MDPAGVRQPSQVIGQGPHQIVDEVIDLSVPFHDGMAAYDSPPRFWAGLTHPYAQRLHRGELSRESRVFLTHDDVGTHIDGPSRFDPQGPSIEQVPLERVIRQASVLDLRASARDRALDRATLASAARQLAAGDAIVLWTGHGESNSSDDHFGQHPYLTEDAAQWLVDAAPSIVAADLPALGDRDDEELTVERKLHAAGILTVEQLSGLSRVEGKTWTFCAAPLRLRGIAGTPIRAVALVGWRATRVVDLTLDSFPGMNTLGAVPTWWPRANHDLTAYVTKGEFSYLSHCLFLSEHAGTHLDAPYHFDPNGQSVEQVPLDGLVAKAVFLDVSKRGPLEPISEVDLAAAANASGTALGAGTAALIYTGHSARYGRTDYGSVRPFITRGATSWLIDQRPSLVATDLVGLDEPADHSSPVHNGLLRAGIPQLQVLTDVDELRGREAWVCAFPLPLVRGTGSPVRAFGALV